MILEIFANINWLGLLLVVLGLSLFIFYAESLFNLGQSNKKRAKLWFFLVLFVPIIISLLASAFTTNLLVFVTTNLLFTYFIALVALGWFFGWSYALWDASGDDKKVWFYLILIFNGLFIIYWVTKIR